MLANLTRWVRILVPQPKHSGPFGARCALVGEALRGSLRWLCVFIAHLPAGYLVALVVERATSSTAAPTSAPRALRRALLVGAVAPDADLLWWWWVDHGAVHHHRYATHLPAVWLASLVLATLWRVSAQTAVLRGALLGLSVGALVHVLLDTVAGDIAWLWPVDDRFFSLVRVPATGGHWVRSFVTHWTFLLELSLVGVAALLLFARRRRPGTKEGEGARSS